MQGGLWSSKAAFLDRGPAQFALTLTSKKCSLSGAPVRMVLHNQGLYSRHFLVNLGHEYAWVHDVTHG